MSEQLIDLGAERPPLQPIQPLLDDRKLVYLAIALTVVMSLWRLYVGMLSNVIWEEGHFVVSGQHLALGYPDIPAGFPWLARLITSIFGWHVQPLRVVAMLIAACLPPAVYFMAQPVTSHRNAIWAAIFSLLLPPLAVNGTIFYPEGALQVLLALMLGCVLRAMQTETPKWWALAGVCAGVGLLTHFRFLVPGLAMVIYLAATPEGRAQWKKPGIWITAGIGFIGLLPGIIYNATHGWPAIEFHVINRPDFDPNPRYLGSFIGTQLVIATPVFLVFLGAAAWTAIMRRRGQIANLLGYQAATIFLFYGLQTFFNKQNMPHWPFMAYVPLLPFLPGLFVAFMDGAKTAGARWLRGTAVALGPLLAFAFGVCCTIYEWEFVHSAELPYAERQHNFLKNENWAALEPDLAAARARAVERFGPDIAYASTGHITAVRMEFPADRNRHVYALGEPYDYLARFIVARQDWRLDRQALLKDHAGKGVVLALNEPSYIYHEADWVQMYGELCQDFEGIERFKIVTLPPGRTSIDLFTARVRVQPLPGMPAQPCPLLPELYIAHPTRGKFLTTTTHTNFFGIAADPVGIEKVDVLIDHKFAAHTRYGLNPKEFQTPDILKYDPDWPNLQYDFTFPDGSLTPGEHVLSIQATRKDGSVVESDPRVLYVTK